MPNANQPLTFVAQVALWKRGYHRVACRWTSTYCICKVPRTWLGGVTSRLSEARLPGRVAAAAAAGICRGLCWIHRKGVIYNDLKPENVLLDSSNLVVLSDFGDARRVEEAAAVPSAKARPAFLLLRVLVPVNRKLVTDIDRSTDSI